ncbi:MAG: dienelactone hydrolase family protein [Deltaproteobacteria bacterium]|nr:dienelactone hydrolase family protein [Deltaproteobacteria bacterium]
MRYIIIIMLLLMPAGEAYAKVVKKDVFYRPGNDVLEGYLAYDDAVKGPMPGVLVFHEWWGINDYIKRRVEEVAALGYIAFAPDMYGRGIRPKDAKSASGLAEILRGDRAVMRERARDGLDELRSNPLTDRARVAAMGYCLGGTVALELARSGADILGAVSFHGNLDAVNPEDAKNIKGRVLVLHGSEDRLASMEQVIAFEDEMRKNGVDWQVNIYGGAVHSFTNPASGNDPSKGVAYNEKAGKRSWEAMKIFLSEIFGKR